jgi:DNA-binding transcriptional MerR regulator
MPSHPEVAAKADVHELYTAVQAAKITGLTTRRLIYLAEQRLVVPSLTRPGGRRRHYSFLDLIELRTIASMTAGENRISTLRVRQVVEALSELRDRPLVSCRLAVCGGKVYWADEKTRTLYDVMRGFQTVLVVDLGYVETDVRRALAAEGLEAPEERTLERIAA